MNADMISNGFEYYSTSTFYEFKIFGLFGDVVKNRQTNYF